MIKHFCDICGEEIERNYAAQPFKNSTVLSGLPGGTSVVVEIRCGIGGTLNLGDICKSCLLRALDMVFDDRPKEANG